MSKQSDYQERHAELGLCRQCPNKQARRSILCRKCLNKRRTLRGHKPWKQGGRGRPPLNQHAD